MLAALADSLRIVGFLDGWRLAGISTDDEQLPIVRPLDSKRIVYELSYIAEWKRRTERGLTPIAPPASVATQMLATPEMPLPVLARIVEAPVFARDGTLQIDAGYHRASRTLYVPASGFTIPSVPERPTARELERAKAEIDVPVPAACRRPPA